MRMEMVRRHLLATLIDLVRERSTATLFVAAKERERVLVLEEGRLAMLASPREALPFQRLVVHSGLVRERELQKALKRADGNRAAFLRLLVEEGQLRREDLRELLQRHLREELDRLLEADPEVTEERPGAAEWSLLGPEAERWKTGLRILPQVLEAARRSADPELRARAAPAGDEILKPTPLGLRQLRESPEGRRRELLSLVDGTRTVAEVLAASEVPQAEGEALVQELLWDGELGPLDPSELLATTHRLRREGRLDRSVPLLLKVAETEAAPRDLALTLGRLYEAMDRAEDAAELLHGQAQRCLREGRLREGGRLLKGLLRLRPADRRARWVRLRLLRRLGEPGRAARDYEKLARLEEDAGRRVRLLRSALVLGGGSARTLRLLRRWNPPVELVEPMLFGAGRALLARGRPGGAVRVARCLLGVTGHGSHAAHLIHAEALEAAGRTRAAARAFEALIASSGACDQTPERERLLLRLLELDPAHRSGRGTLAVLLRETGRNEEALRQLRFLEVLEAGSVDVEARVSLLRSMLELDPTLLAERRELAETLQGLGRRDEAAAALREVGLESFRRGDPTGARDALRESIRMTPLDLEAHQTLVAVYRRHPDLGSAADQAGRLAQILLHTGRIEEGLRALRELLAIDPEAAPDATPVLAAWEQDEGSDLAEEVLLLLARRHATRNNLGTARDLLHRLIRKGARTAEAGMLLQECERGRVEAVKEGTRNQDAIAPPAAPVRPPAPLPESEETPASEDGATAGPLILEALTASFEPSQVAGTVAQKPAEGEEESLRGILDRLRSIRS
jgi:tetratricopeptide (TPR) repeat protein